MPLHEIYLFSSPGAVRYDDIMMMMIVMMILMMMIRRHLVGAPRAALHTALTDPWEYLDHKELKIADIGEISPAFPDICIGYKLHLECQKLINVYDWLLCWNTIANTGAGETEAEAPDQVSMQHNRVCAPVQLYC